MVLSQDPLQKELQIIESLIVNTMYERQMPPEQTLALLLSDNDIVRNNYITVRALLD